MKVTFLGIGVEQLGISQLSATLKAHGHKTNLAFSAQLFNDRFNLQMPGIAKYFDDTADAIRTIRETQPDVVAFGALTSTYQWGLEVAAAAKAMNPDVKVVFGGVHVSAVPHLVLNYPQIDYAVVGEGDVAFPAILKSIESNDYQTPIINTQYKGKNGSIIRGKQGAFIQDLDSLPFADKTIWEDYVRIGDFYLIMATRGCPYRCSFCFNNFFANLPDEDGGKYVRLRSVDHVIAELKYAKRRYNLKTIDFQDDVFGTQKKWLREFSEKYKKEINIPYQILTHPKFMDEEKGKLLRESGCEFIQLGIQSMDEDFKKDSLLRYEKTEDIDRALSVMNKNNLKVRIDHMFGLPNEPISAQVNALNLYKKYDVARINTFWTCYLPGTQMMNEAIVDGQLTQKQVDDINEGRDFFFYRNTDNVKDKDLQQLYRSYEFIFRIIPMLPKFLKKRIELKHVTWIPPFLNTIIITVNDVLSGLLYQLASHIAYLYHYVFHLYRFMLLKLGFRNIKATKPKVIEDINAYYPQKKQVSEVEKEKLSLKELVP